MSSSAIEELFERFGPRYRLYVSLTGMLAVITAVLSATMINVAIPDIMGAFGVGQDQAQWLSTGFLAAAPVTMLLNDWAVRTFGMRNTYIGAMTVFAIGAVIGGLSPTFNTIVLARVMQGAAAGFVQPLAMIIMFQVFPPDQRGRAMGLFGVGVVLAPAMGPTLGGVLVDAFSWREVFFAGIPVAVIGSGLALIFMPRREPDEPRPRFDWIGFILLSTAVAALLNGLSNGQRLGWHTFEIQAYLAYAGIAFISFIAWESNIRQPMMNVRLFLNPHFASMAVVGAVLGVILFGSTYLIPLFVQTVQGYSATRAGLLVMPAGLALMACFPLGGRLSDKLPRHYLLCFGLTLYIISTLLMLQAHTDTPFWLFANWIIVGRIGMAFIMPTLSVSALRSLTPEQMGQGSGTVNFVRQIGGAFGVNLLAVNLERETAVFANAYASVQTYANSTTLQTTNLLERLLAQDGLPYLTQKAGALHLLGQSLHAQATMMAFRADFLYIAILCVIALIPAFLGARDPSRKLQIFTRAA